jgi:MoxR-like ATPase
MPASAEGIVASFAAHGYVADRALAMTVLLATRIDKPMLLEGEAGVGKTEVAKVLARALETELIRLQCYEGLDVHTALYEWNYARQMLSIRVAEAAGERREAIEQSLFAEDFLLERPLLRAITADRRVVLLIDEVDKSDEEFEAFLLEVLSDFQVTVPELGTIPARHRPVVVLTSNCTREPSEALKRRCLHLYVDFPGTEKEAEILALKVPEADEKLREQVAQFVHRLRKLDLKKAPSIAETLDWCRALCALGIAGLEAAGVRQTLNLLLKHEDDIRKAEPKVPSLLGAGR